MSQSALVSSSVFAGRYHLFSCGNDNNSELCLFPLNFFLREKTSSKWEVIETATLAHVGVSQLTRRKEWKVNSKSSNRNRLEQGAHLQDFLQVLMVTSHRIPTYYLIC